MSKIEKKLQGHTFPLIIMGIVLLIWLSRYFVTEKQITSVTIYGLFFLSIPFFIIISKYKNSVYTIPIILTMTFSVAIPNISINTLNEVIPAIIHVALIIIGMLIHIIRFKVKFKLKTISISLILVIISFFVPLIYTPFSGLSLILASLSIFYFIIFIFYANTIQGNQINFLMRNLSYLGVLLTLQLLSMWIFGLTIYKGNNILADFISIFPKSHPISVPGWGNINDLTIQIVLASASVIYYLHKYPKSIFPWLLLGWLSLWVYMSDSRGSMITITFSAIGAIVYTIFKRDKNQLKNLGIASLIALGIMFVISPSILNMLNSFFSSIDINDPNKTLTGRIELWITNEYSAINLFKMYPLFGSGWRTPDFVLLANENRVTIYHSTFFHVLATGGLFGIGVLVFHFKQVFSLFKSNIKLKAVSAILFTFVLTQIHGLIDNTQYMFSYTLTTFIMFAVISNIPKIKGDSNEK